MPRSKSRPSNRTPDGPADSRVPGGKSSARPAPARHRSDGQSITISRGGSSPASASSSNTSAASSLFHVAFGVAAPSISRTSTLTVGWRSAAKTAPGALRSRSPAKATTSDNGGLAAPSAKKCRATCRKYSPKRRRAVSLSGRGTVKSSNTSTRSSYPLDREPARASGSSGHVSSQALPVRVRQPPAGRHAQGLLRRPRLGRAARTAQGAGRGARARQGRGARMHLELPRCVLGGASHRRRAGSFHVRSGSAGRSARDRRRARAGEHVERLVLGPDDFGEPGK